MSYVPSPEHKQHLTEAGPGKLRSDASACPKELSSATAVAWLRSAVRDRRVSAAFEGDFPRYVWARVDDDVYEARLTNSDQGQYKGYPILPNEAPGWLS